MELVRPAENTRPALAERRGLPRCVGRDRELAGLERLYGEAIDGGRGRVALVAGPAGIGKTRLMQELRRRLKARGATVLEGRSREGARAYEPILEVIDSAVRALGDVGASRAAAQGIDVSEALKGRSGDGRGLVDGSAASELRRVALYERVAGFVAEAARHLPLAILIHDLHLADGATRALAAHLAQTRAASPELEHSAEDRLRALVVVSSRDDDRGWLEGVAAERFALAGLDEDGIREFLQAPEVVQFFAAATGGQPRALEALLEAPPADADDLFRALCDRLSPEARRVLGALSLFGRPAGAEALRRVATVAGDELGRAVAELCEAHVLCKVVVDGELRLGFARSSDEEATRRGLDEGERARLHARIGRFLLGSAPANGGADGAVRIQADDADVVAAAEHLCRGGAGDEAVAAALVAGERLSITFGYDRAIALYRLAWALACDAERAELERRMVELKRLVGDYAGALEDAERLRQRSPEDPEAWRRIGQLHLLRDEFSAARAALSRARELAAADPMECARVLAASAEVSFLDGRAAEARAECEAGLTRIEGDGEAAVLRLEVRNTLGKVHLAEGRWAEAAQLFADNLAEARSLAAPWEETRALINEGIAHLRLGDDARAAQCYRAALKVADAVEDHRHRAFCLQNLGVLAQARSDWATAVRYFQESVAAFKKIGHRGRLAWVAQNLAWLYLDLHAVDKAAAMAALADRLGGDNAASPVAINRAVIAGRIAHGRGDPDAARERFEAARTLARDAADRDRLAEATLHLAQLELDAGDAAAAGRLVAGLAGGAEGLSKALRARARRRAGARALARRDLPPARQALLEAFDLFHRLSDLDGEWRAQFALARVAELAGDHAESERRLRAAATVDGRIRERVPEELAEAFANDPSRRALTRALAEPAVRPSKAAAAMPPRLALVRDAAPAPDPERYGRIIGRHPRVRQLFGLLDKVAPHDSIVLIRGESGTGKELIADALHAGSRRAGKPLVKVNCGALVESLLLSELFGHERGAFTGAVQRKKGRFEAADGGTIFLDEIGDISPRTQVALLRVLQERQFERVGSTTPVRVDVRILCATNRDLEGMVARGEFREDLYYRLKGIQIDVPALRDRAEDVPLLAEAFLQRVAEERGGPQKRLSDDAVDLLCRHAWPGNVRELENVIRSVSLFCEGPVIAARDFADFPELVRPAPRPARAQGPLPSVRPTRGAAPEAAAGWSAWERLGAEGLGLRELQERIEIECITRALAEARGNITRAAELLKMKRPRLSQLIKEYGISLQSNGEGP